MNKKIVTIFMLLFMFTMSTFVMTLLQFVTKNNELDLNVARADQSVLSLDGEVTNEIHMTGVTLISSVESMKKIDTQRQIAKKPSIYSDYEIVKGSTKITLDNMSTAITPSKEYLVKYDTTAHRITIQEV